MPSEAQIIGGHKSTLHNPNTSAEAKDHSREILKDDYNRKPSLTVVIGPKVSKQPELTLFAVIVDGNKTKDVNHVAAGLKR